MIKFIVTLKGYLKLHGLPTKNKYSFIKFYKLWSDSYYNYYKIRLKKLIK